MVFVNKITNAKGTANVGRAAEAIVIKLAGGWIFVTHEGEMIGPDPDRDIVVAKAALYLSAFKGGAQ
ncbi:MAG: hypothetical protein DRQ56_06940 [Gammaproteobacteria bacterium]|nr:MAG: hypothetical protein DRQ56_06940 [Gammaproteobacteria bacterium]